MKTEFNKKKNSKPVKTTEPQKFDTQNQNKTIIYYSL